MPFITSSRHLLTLDSSPSCDDFLLPPLSPSLSLSTNSSSSSRSTAPPSPSLSLGTTFASPFLPRLTSSALNQLQQEKFGSRTRSKSPMRAAPAQGLHELPEVPGGAWLGRGRAAEGREWAALVAKLGREAEKADESLGDYSTRPGTIAPRPITDPRKPYAPTMSRTTVPNYVSRSHKPKSSFVSGWVGSLAGGDEMGVNALGLFSDVSKYIR